jgi:hypothetical protein
LFLHCLLVSIYGIIKFIELKEKKEEIFFPINLIYISLVLLFSLSTLIILIYMILQNIYLISKNITINEKMREIKYPGNVFDNGFKQNWLDFFKRV